MPNKKETCPKCASPLRVNYRDASEYTCGSVFSVMMDNKQSISQVCTRITALENEVKELKEALDECSNSMVLMLGHSVHWDHTMQGGLGCYKCIEQRKLVLQIQSRASALLEKKGMD